MTESIVTDEEVKEPVKSRRDQAYDALIAKRESEKAVEPEKEPEQEPVNDPEMIELIGEDGNPIKVPISAKYKAKIDGNEIEVPFDKLTRSYQIGASADNRMKAVSDKQKELEEKERALEARGQELTQKEKAYIENQQNLVSQKESGKIDDARFKELSKRLLSALTDDDNPETAIESVLKEMVPSIDADKIASEAQKKALEAVEERERKNKEKAEAKRQDDLEKARIAANEKFEAALDNEFKILKEDPDLMRLAKSYANDEYHKNPDGDPWEVISGAVNKVVEFRKRYTTEPTKPTKTPKSASARASIGEDKQPETRQDILNTMRKSRGQPVLR